MLHLLSINGTSNCCFYLSHNFQNNEIFMTKNWSIVPRYWGTMSH